MECIRYVQKEDIDFWLSLDRHISKLELQKKIRDQMGYVLFKDTKPVGILRYNFLWDTIPFCTIICIAPDFQHLGYGKRLMEYWEKCMKNLGHGMVMTSTRVDELAQHFYRALGYQDSGGLVITISPHEQPMELFFSKSI